jgi:hypothetical protein
MPVSCDPNDLMEGAKCISCATTQAMRDSIKIYLLCQIAGVSTDPNFLLAQANDLQSVPQQSLKAIEVWLLCQIVNAP